MKLFLYVNREKCSACGACAIACMDQNDIDVESGVKPLRTISESEDQNRFEYDSSSCMHCEDAPCITVCPQRCIWKDGATGLTIYDNTDCIGCRRCEAACPFDAISYGTDGKMMKCDGCIDRLRDHRKPACISSCPTDAIELKDRSDRAADRSPIL